MGSFAERSTTSSIPPRLDTSHLQYVAAYPAPPELAVPIRILNKLRTLGAQVAPVAVATENNMGVGRNWRLLVATDENVDYFVIRDASRLSKRDALAIRDWLLSAEREPQTAVVHCIRDHPKHAEQGIVDGLWGGQPRKLRKLLKHDITNLLRRAALSASFNKNDLVETILRDRLWPAVSNASYCHDSVSPCDWHIQSRSQFPLPPRHNVEYIGQKFDAHQQLLSTGGDLLQNDVVCSLSNTFSNSSFGSSPIAYHPKPLRQN